MDITPLAVILAIALVIAFQAGALLMLARFLNPQLTIWIGWFAFFLLLAASRDGSASFRVFVSSSAASAVYQLTTQPFFRRKDINGEDRDESDSNNGSNKGV